MTARQELGELRAELDRARSLIVDLMRHAGEPGVCRACKAAVTFIHHPRTGRAGIYDADGRTHFATCSDPARFRKKSSASYDAKSPEGEKYA